MIKLIRDQDGLECLAVVTERVQLAVVDRLTDKIDSMLEGLDIKELLFLSDELKTLQKQPKESAPVKKQRAKPQTQLN